MSTQPSNSKAVLDDLLTLDTLQEMAENSVFREGQLYFFDDRVEVLARDAQLLAGVVSGVDAYRTRLSVAGGRLDYACTCPAGQSGEFCKHCVALGFAWVDGQQPASAGDKGSD